MKVSMSASFLFIVELNLHQLYFGSTGIKIT